MLGSTGRCAREAGGAAGRRSQLVLSNTAHLSQNETHTPQIVRDESDQFYVILAQDDCSKSPRFVHDYPETGLEMSASLSGAHRFPTAEICVWAIGELSQAYPDTIFQPLPVRSDVFS